MSVRIRLAKTGKTHQVSYRIVAQDARAKRDGRFLEILGYFQPYIKSSANLKVDRQKVNFWLAKGAKPTDAVAKLIRLSDNQAFGSETQVVQTRRARRVIRSSGRKNPENPAA